MKTDKHRSENDLQRAEAITKNHRPQNGRHKQSVSIRVYLWLILCAFASTSAPAQVAPVYDRGVMGLAQVLKRLNTSASAMMIGAHPDDEDTALLAYLARGENARTAYLSLTRGDGGQNIIGPELGEALGVIRTEELLQARRLDGAEQYFTRAYDYGFSKTLAEAQSKWPEQVILCDAVRSIRAFRPLVVISQFSGTPADGHGQHQYAGYIAPIAVDAAADANQCRDAGPTWKVKKLYVRHGFRATTEPRLRENTGKYDPILGRSYFEIAMEARIQHKSLEQGVL
jgi:LmbE family N-acetylglucosaminyl deacetylase